MSKAFMINLDKHPLKITLAKIIKFPILIFHQTPVHLSNHSYATPV